MTEQGHQQPLRFISPDQRQVGSVAIGDIAVTAGGPSALAPADIPIGVVTEVTREPGTGGADAIAFNVEPDSAFVDGSDLQVILYEPSDESS